MFKRLKIKTSCIIILAAFTLFPALKIYAKEGNWGLGFGEPGAVPRGNESSEHLKQFDAYFVDDSGDKVIYLTFDAGFENGNTTPILDTLKKNNVPAAFFLVGPYIKNNQELIKRMTEEGHIVGNHTMSHPDMSAISSKEQFKKELEGAEEIYRSVTGNEMPKYYRPPSGKYSDENMKMAQELGYKTIFWSSAYVDWNVDKQPSKDEAFSKLLPRIHPGAILLLHSTSKTNANILDEFISRCHEMGYEFKSLDDLAK